MTNKKSNLTSKLGTAILSIATGLTGLVGCEAPQTSRESIYQPNYQEQTQTPAYPNTTENESDLPLAIMGGILGAGVLSPVIPKITPNLSSRAIAESVTRGAGNAMLAEATKTKINVNVNNGMTYSQEVQSPALDERLLPEYDLKELEADWNKSPTPYPAYGTISSVFTSRNTLDLNGDKAFSFNEFIGIRRNFKKGEPVQINVNLLAPTSDLFFIKPLEYQLTYEILDERGNILYTESSRKKHGKYCESTVLTAKIPEPEPGIYVIRCTYLNENKKANKLIRSAVFQVLEDK